jgi:tartrate dehydrogenase/decarboxylase/D-malate dehydrogenase
MTLKKYKIAAVPGDGVGKELIPVGQKILEKLSAVDGGFQLEFEYFPYGCEYYLEKGHIMDQDGLDRLKGFDAIYLGAVGHPEVPDWVASDGLLYTIRKGFNQYVNLRPIRQLPGVASPVTVDGKVDITFVRENTEGEYGDIGGIFRENSSHEIAIQTNVFSRLATERIMDYAFQLSQKKKGTVTSVTKSNALKHSMVFWDKIFNELSAKYPGIETQSIFADAMAMFMISKPQTFDVVVASNLFGDILTDLGSVLVGGLGFAPGGNINPEKEFPSMFEPIHGSAPDIAGKGICNPVATIWAGQMILEFLDEQPAADRLMNAITNVCAQGKVRTPDMGGTNTTQEMGDAILAEL